MRTALSDILEVFVKVIFKIIIELGVELLFELLFRYEVLYFLIAIILLFILVRAITYLSDQISGKRKTVGWVEVTKPKIKHHDRQR